MEKFDAEKYEKNNTEQKKIRDFQIAFSRAIRPYADMYAKLISHCPPRYICVKNFAGIPIKLDDIIQITPSAEEKLLQKNFNILCQYLLKEIAASLGLPAEIINNVSIDFPQTGPRPEPLIEI